MNLIKKLLIVCAVLGVSFNANASSVYQVNGLKVEFKKFNASKVRALAVDVATKKGFKKLLENIVPEQYNTKEILDSVDLKKTDIVEKLSIVSEVNKRGLYQAEIDILYSTEKVKKILEVRRVPFTQEVMGKVLLLPIKKDSQTGRLELFEESNVFKTELFANLENSLIMQPVLAKGELQEITNYNPQMLLDKNNKQTVINLANKYETDKAIVLLLEENDFSGNKVYQLTVNYVNFKNMEDSSTVVIATSVQDASKKVAENLTQNWLSANLLEFNKPKRFMAMVDTDGSMENLYATINAMKALNIVSDVNIKQVTTNYAFVQTDFYGTPKEFLNLTAKNKLNVFQTPDGQWKIERVGR